MQSLSTPLTTVSLKIGTSGPSKHTTKKADWRLRRFGAMESSKDGATPNDRGLQWLVGSRHAMHAIKEEKMHQSVEFPRHRK